MSAVTPKRWPNNAEYVEAVQDLSWCFADAELRDGMTEPGGVMGVPKCATGQNAIVFPIVTAQRKWAVRCFTTPAAEGQRRYEAFSNYLADRHCPTLVAAAWLGQGIQTDLGWWPIVKMEWIDGRTLREVVANNLYAPDQLRLLADQWRAAVRTLRHIKLAHGDLQHGNVLIDADGALRFVDYDGIWLPELAEAPSKEVGHPNYQHPERLATGYCDEYIDTFSALVIHTSLRALAADATLWDLHNGENLIFRADDYTDPTGAPIWRRLRSSPDAEVVRFGELLSTACRRTVKVATDLDEILDAGRIPEAVAYRSAKGTVPWYHPDYEQAEKDAAEATIDVKSDWQRIHAGEAIAADPTAIVPPPPPAVVGSQARDWRVVVIVILLLLSLLAAAVTVIATVAK